MRHIIHKQVLQLTIGPKLEAFAIQHAASRFYREILVPLLERVFDELAGEGEVIRVDRFVLDLGMLSEQQLNSLSFEQTLYALLRTQLRQMVNGDVKEVIVARMPRQEGVLEQWWYYMEKGRLSWNADTVDANWYRLVLETFSIDYEAVSRLRRALEEQPVFRQRVSLQHPDEFLETLTGILTGTRQALLCERIEEVCSLCRWLEKTYRKGAILPEWDSQENEVVFETLGHWVDEHLVFLTLAVKEQKATIWELVLRAAAMRPAEMRSDGVIRLLSRWLTEDRCIYLLIKKAGLGWSFIRDAGDETPDIIQQAGKRDPTMGSPPAQDGGIDPDTGVPRASVWEDTPMAARDDKNGGGGTDMQEQRDASSAGAGMDASEVQLKKADRNTANTIVERDDTRKEDTAMGARDNGSVTGPEMAAPRPTEKEPGDSGDLPVPLSREKQEGALFDRRAVDEEGLFGQYAGLILLHPFLTTLFTRCGLYEGGQFVDKAARQRAVFLLYYLGTGEKGGPEYALLFPKLFCGYSLEQPLPASMEMHEGVYTEAEDLLQMVLQRWDKLKNSSAGALREGFLQRAGKLVKRGDRLVLMVEVGAIDVLLDYLPWNLSMVKLPWLKELLYVEWR